MKRPHVFEELEPLAKVAKTLFGEGTYVQATHVPDSEIRIRVWPSRYAWACSSPVLLEGPLSFVRKGLYGLLDERVNPAEVETAVGCLRE